MPMSTCCRDALVSIGSIILFGVSLTLTTIGIIPPFDIPDDQDEDLDYSGGTYMKLLLSLSPIPMIVMFIMIWFCCCHRQQVSNARFDTYFVFFVLYFGAGFAVMLLLGTFSLALGLFGIETGIFLIPFSLLPFAISIGFPVYFCRRRHRFIRRNEEETGETEEEMRRAQRENEDNHRSWNAPSPFNSAHRLDEREVEEQSFEPENEQPRI